MKFLAIEGPFSTNTGASVISPIKSFRNLVYLTVDDDEGQCTFKLNNDDVTELAIALPQLESLLLVRPCYENTCPITVACLLSISVHCVMLEELTIHFNTANIVGDFRYILEVP